MNKDTQEDFSKTTRAQCLKDDNSALQQAFERVYQLTIIDGPGLGSNFRLTLFSRSFMLGRGDADFIIPHDTVSRRHASISMNQAGQVWIYDQNSTNGTFVNGKKITSTMLKDGDKIQVGDVVLRYDLLDPVEARFHSELARKISEANRDPLMRLFSRKYLEEEAPRLLMLFQTQKRSLSVGMLDIDFFKKVNDTYGHLAGDAILKAVGQIIQKMSSTHAIPCRYGGEEVVILFPDHNEIAAFKACELLRLDISQATFPEIDPSTKVTVSFGVACMLPGETLEQLLIRADRALYLAKNEGRNRTKLASA